MVHPLPVAYTTEGHMFLSMCVLAYNVVLYLQGLYYQLNVGLVNLLAIKFLYLYIDVKRHLFFCVKGLNVGKYQLKM